MTGGYRQISEDELLQKLKNLPISFNGHAPNVIELKFGWGGVLIKEENDNIKGGDEK